MRSKYRNTILAKKLSFSYSMSMSWAFVEKTKAQISCAVIVQLITAAVIVQLISALVFRHIEGTTPLLFKSEIKPPAVFCSCTAWFVSDLVGTPQVLSDLAHFILALPNLF